MAKNQMDAGKWAKMAKGLRADMDKAPTPHAKCAVLARGVEGVLRECGFSPESVEIGTRMVIYFVERDEAERCAMWGFQNGLKVECVDPGDADIGPSVYVDF